MKPSSVSGDRRRRGAADSGKIEEQEFLPEGWTVEARARRNGKNDKYYLSPSKQHKFYSMSEVSRYLNSLQTSSPNPDENKNITNKRPAENVVIEKAPAEGLPPGWIKEIKVTKKGGKMRRDPYYTDPDTGYIFRSMKDALRYVETGSVGRLASKPKDKGCDDVELEDNNVPSTVVSKKQRTSDTGDCNEDLNSKMKEAERDEQSLKSSTCTEVYPPLSGHTSGVVDAELSCADLPKSKDSEEIGKQTQTEEKVNGGATGSDKKRKPKDKRISNQPRRTSKRLAGADVDPALEIKPNVRGHRIAVKESYEAPFSHQKVDQRQSVTDVLVESNDSNHHPCVDSASPGTKDEGVEREGDASMLPPEILFRDVEEADRGDDKSLSSLDLPFDILNDPCIEFAIKTLTGTAFDASEVLAGSNNSSQYIQDIGEHAGKVAVEYPGDENQTLLPQSIPGKAVQTKNKEVVKPGPTLDGDFWTDPCIEFAVKTLTGAIPLEYDMSIRDFTQGPNATQTQTPQGNNELTLSNVDIYQADFWCPQFTTAEFKQQNPSAAPQSASVSFRSSSGTSVWPAGATRP